MTERSTPAYLLDRHIDAGDGDRLALTGEHGELTYARAASTASGAPPPASAPPACSPSSGC